MIQTDQDVNWEGVTTAATTVQEVHRMCRAARPNISPENIFVRIYISSRDYNTGTALHDGTNIYLEIRCLKTLFELFMIIMIIMYEEILILDH